MNALQLHPTLGHPLAFVVTHAHHGPVVRVRLAELASATNLDVTGEYGELLPRDLAVAAVAKAGGTVEEIRAVGDAFDHAMTEARVSAPAAPVEPTRIRPHLREVPRPPEAPVVLTGRQAFGEAEKAQMLAALRATGWNKLRAAEKIGMPRRTFYRRLAEYQIHDE